MKLKKGDKIKVIAGKDKGATGAIAFVLPKSNKVIIDGVNISKKHRKPSMRNKKGQIINKAMPIDVSNVQLVDPKSGEVSRISVRRDENGRRERVATKSGRTL